MKQKLLKRKYNVEKLNKQIEKVDLIERKELLQNNEKLLQNNSKKEIPLASTDSKTLSNL